jgi:phage tail P2-like protein
VAVVVLPGSLTLNATISGVVVGTAVVVTGPAFLGVTVLLDAADALISVDSSLVGDLRVRRIVLDTLAEGRRALELTPFGRIANQFTLPSTPLLVHAIDAREPPDVEDAHTPLNAHFLVAADFVSSGPGDPFGDHGAKAGSLGSRRQVNPIIYTFRDAFPYEVVWFVEIDDQGRRADRGLYRWQPNRNGVFGWTAYRSMPERALAGTQVFDLFDPDKIYDYYARLVGAVLFEWTRDARAVLDFIDPNLCPERLLNFLGESFGLTFTASDPEAIKRQRIATAIPSFKKKGLEESYLIRLRSLNLQADVREVWVNPTHVDNWEAFVDAPAAIQADAIARGVAGAIRTESGQKGQDFIMPPHGYFGEETDPVFGTYYPSSRIAIFVNDAAGNPLSPGISDEDLTALRNLIVQELRDHLMPLHVDIRFFGTRVPMEDAQDTLELTDTLTFSNPTNFPFHAEIVLEPEVEGELLVTV